MRRESKVAWKKENAWNQRLLALLRSGGEVPHAELLKAVDDPDGRIVFDPTDSHPLRKEDHVIFQYAVWIARPDGRVACFQRAALEKGSPRMTSGFSFLISNSSPEAPSHAIPAMLQYEVCVGKRSRMASSTPVGLIWNALPPSSNGRPKPTYLFALYRHELRDDIPLHGRFKETPDEMKDWFRPDELPRLTEQSGYIDQLIARQIAAGAFTSIDEGYNGIVYSPESRLVASPMPSAPFGLGEYTHGHSVFISHASEDSFAAYALYRFLMDESSRTILPSLDLQHVRDGDHLSEKIFRLISDCDGVVLVITPALLAKSAEMARTGEPDWVRKEIEIAIGLGKPILGFKLGTLGRPDYLPADIVSNNRAAYGDWLHEIRALIDRVREVFNIAR